MSGEKEENLFEELDFGSFVSELEDSIEVDQVEGPESTEEVNIIEEQNLEASLQGTEESAEDADASEETQETIEETEDSEGSEDNDDNSSPLTPYAKLLVDDGILPNFNLEAYDGTADGLKDAMTTEINTGIEDYKNQLPEEVKSLLENYEEGVPLSRLLEIDEKRTEYKSIKQEQLSGSKDLQKAIMNDYYKNTTKFTEDKINKLIQISEDLDNLEGESQEALTDLISFQDEYEAEEVKAAQDNKIVREEAQKKNLEDFKKTLDSSDEIIPNVKVSKNIKDSLYKIMTTPVGQDDNGVPVNKIGKYRLENPHEFDITLSYLFEVTKGFSDWSVLSSAGKAKAVRSFEESIARQDYKGSTGKLGTKSSKPSSSKGLLDEISKINFK